MIIAMIPWIHLKYPFLMKLMIAMLVAMMPTLQKKDTSVTFWAERIFFCHTYGTSMTIIVTKPGIIIDVVGGPETQLHDILWAVHDGKNRGRSKGEENFREFPVTVGCQGRAMRIFSYMYARVCEVLGCN